MEDYLKKDGKSNTSFVVKPETGGNRKYTGTFKNSGRDARFLLWCFGRNHRIQWDRNKKIYYGGERKYNGSFSFCAYAGKYGENFGNG